MEQFFVYSFLGLMLFNLLASFVYLMGVNQLGTILRRALKAAFSQKPR